jgi:BirA family transcriptional regulator, biotin operon repressor / biotin---[acetyl-CoA-carboxylase] ligase
MQLDPVAVDAGVRLLALATIGSTNEEASARARHGERGPLWITAQAQTAGRGRLGRSWNSPPGNLYASLLLSDPAPFERAPELAFVAVLALRDAIVAEVPALAPHLAFKWPNDLLLKGGKCGGILIEGEVEPGKPGKTVSVVIGIGVNCAHHPPTASAPASDDAKPARLRAVPFGEQAVLFPATDLRAHGADIMPAQLFQRLSATMYQRIAQWDRGHGFSAILGDWLSAARGLGEHIRVRNGSGEKTGRFVGLDQSGRLVLERPGGALEKISAGDVFPFARRHGWKIPSRQD